MATASRIFSAAGQMREATALSTLAASALALEPGQMCLVSMACRGGDGLLPLAITHAQPTASRQLQRLLAPRRQTPADAFSRAVFRSGGALRMAISSPRLLRLWLPDAYWPYVERTGVNSVLAAALRDHNRVFGTLLLWRERDHPAFDELDLAYVVSLAARLTLGLATDPMLASMAPASVS
jgi:GAF domain-containing protein